MHAEKLKVCSMVQTVLSTCFERLFFNLSCQMPRTAVYHVNWLLRASQEEDREEKAKSLKSGWYKPIRGLIRVLVDGRVRICCDLYCWVVFCWWWSVVRVCC